jgi:virulence-associated protein VagC
MIMNVELNKTIRAKLFKTGHNRAFNIPKEFDFDGDAVEMSLMRDGRVLIKPILKGGKDEQLKKG